jgi:nitrite reductase/ring-hydroxylating ferredoxin subunit
MVVKSDVDGKLYEVDRYCPHKGVDMKGVCG